MIQKAEKRAATVKTRRHSRRRRSSEDETDTACSVPSALYRKNAGRVRLMIRAAVLPFEPAVETAFMPVHRVAHAVDNSDNIASAFADTGADRRLSGNCVPVPFKLNKYVLPGERAVILFAACRP
jgi:hypothetical protein